MKGKKYILLKAKKIPVWLKYWAYKKGGVTPTLKNLYLGYSRQETTTGKQLFNKNDLTGSNCTIEYSNGLYNATKTGSSPKIISNISLPAGDYTINSVGNLGTIIFYNGSTLVKSISDNHRYYNFTLDSEVNNVKFWFTGDSYSFDFDSLIITSGTYTSETMPTWERYTGGIPAPNPNYPFEIENLTGNVPIQAGNKVINFPLSNGQKLYKDCILTENGIQYKRTDITLYNRSWAVYNVTDNLGNTYGFSNALSKEPRQSQVLVDFALSNILTQQKRSNVSSIDNEGFYLGNGNRLYIKIRQDLLPNGTTNELTQLLTNKNASLEYELAETETIPYTEAQQQAYINLCKYFEENTDLNEYIVGG